MARIRTIKPEFCTSDQIVECSTSARLLFVTMWCFCDDGGVHVASLKRLKMEVFPADPFTDEQMQQWIDELLAADLLREYVVDNKADWIVTGWHHQKIDRPTNKYPRPDKHTKFVEHSARPRRALDEASPPEGSLREGSLREGSLREGSLREGSLPISLPSGSSCRQAANGLDLHTPEPDEVTGKSYLARAEQVLQFLNQRANRAFQARAPNGKPSANAQFVVALLKKGYSEQDMRTVIARKAREWTPTSTNGKDMTQYLTPETLFRPSKFEKYLGECVAHG